MIAYRVLSISVVSLLLACSGGGGSGADSPSSTSPPPALPPSAVSADVTILFMGNSHTSINGLSGTVTSMVRLGSPGKTVASVEAPGWMHLEERASDAASLALLRGQRWSFVVLQAQNYSLSGVTVYPTTGAELLVREARAAGAVPVLFPEWPRRGINETSLLIDTYVSIARKEPACVAPIPHAFDLTLARHPALTMLDADGNHSAPAGAFLAALMLFATIADRSPVDLPTLALTNVDSETQRMLRAIATETVQTHPPRLWCPLDRQPS